MKKIIINIGRQFGSGGRDIARELGRKLDLPVYDQELLSKAAEESGFGRELFKQQDEKHRRFMFRAFSSLLRDGADDGPMSESQIFMIQSETIRHIAENGSAIIVGRCADYILRDMDCTLNVFLTSPDDVRCRRVQQRMNVSEDVAKEIIAKKDRNRPDYYNYFTFGKWGYAATYDLCLDSSILGVEGTADLIIEFARKSGKLDE